MFRATQVPSVSCSGFRVRGCHPLWPDFPVASANLYSRTGDGPTTPRDASPHPRFGLLRVRSPLLTQSLLLSLPPGTEMFQFPGFASRLCRDAGVASGGLPHSEIRASKSICLLTRLIAACHVLLRLREPRHPSCALLSFPCVFRRKPRGQFLVRLWSMSVVDTSCRGYPRSCSRSSCD